MQHKQVSFQQFESPQIRFETVPPLLQFREAATRASGLAAVEPETQHRHSKLLFSTELLS